MKTSTAAFIIVFGWLTVHAARAQDPAPKFVTLSKRRVEPSALQFWRQVRAAHAKTHSLRFTLLARRPIDSDDTEWLQAQVVWARPGRWRFETSSLNGPSSSGSGIPIPRRLIVSGDAATLLDFNGQVRRRSLQSQNTQQFLSERLLFTGLSEVEGLLNAAPEVRKPEHLQVLGVRRVNGQWCRGVERGTFWSNETGDGGTVERWWFGASDLLLRRIESYDFQAAGKPTRNLVDLLQVRSNFKVAPHTFDFKAPAPLF